MFFEQLTTHEREIIRRFCHFCPGGLNVVKFVVSFLDFVVIGVVLAELAVVEAFLTLSVVVLLLALVNIVTIVTLSLICVLESLLGYFVHGSQVVIEDVLVGHLLVKNDSAPELKHLHHLLFSFVAGFVLADLVY